MGGDPGRADEKVVEAVMKEKRVGGVLLKALPNFFDADRAVATGVAGTAGAAVAAEGFMVEETLSFAHSSGRDLGEYPRRGNDRVKGMCEGARERDGRDQGNERSIHGNLLEYRKT